MNDSDDDVPKTTAGFFRSKGIRIRDDIPDCAWVPQGSWHFGPTTTASGDNNELFVDVSIVFDEPFRWFECTVFVKPQEGN